MDSRKITASGLIEAAQWTVKTAALTGLILTVAAIALGRMIPQ